MKHRTILTLVAAWALVTMMGCSDPDEQGPYELGGFTVEVTEDSVSVKRADGTVLLGGTRADGKPSVGLPGAAGWRTSQAKVTNLFGMFLFDDQGPSWTTPDKISVVSFGGGKLTLKVEGATAVLSVEKAGVLKVSWSTEAKGANRFVQTFACSQGEKFFGLGALVHGTEHRGEVVPAWTSEQGIGKLRRKTQADGFPLKGDLHDSYHPVPFVMSSRGFGLLVRNSHRSLFHLCAASASDRWGVETWDGKLEYLLVDGPELTRVLERLTSITGRPRLLPKWAFAPWIDIIHGQQKVLDGARKLRKAGIPSSAVWTEDWIGGGSKSGGYHLNYQWSADTKLYPDLKKLAAQLNALGFRFLGYFNPFLEEGFDNYKEALAKGYAIKDDKGKLVSFSGVFFKKTTLPDLSDPKVVTWLKGYLKKAADLGFDGWMADYAEWLPVEARLSDGKTGHEAHNLYPLMWQKANRELLDSVHKDGDYVFFVRSGWAGTGGLAPVVWAGDQQTEFGGYDGMESVIPICVNLGMSGIPIATHDIGGYSTVNIKERTRELFYRWTELAAFSPVMRTHHGASADKNWQWDQDAETLAFFARYARLHVALFPYRYTLARVATDRGLPMMRHLALHFASDAGVAAVKDQFLLGPALLVAPVQADKARSRKVYLPSTTGGWFHYFTGKRHEGGKSHTVKADLEEVPVFAPAGAIIPLFLAQVDTLAEATDATVVDIKKAEAGALGLKVFLGADGKLTQYDGASFTLDHVKAPTSAPDSFKVDGKAWPACAAGSKKDCMTVSASSATLYVGAAKAFKISGAEKGGSLFLFEVKGAPAARDFEVTVYW